MPLRRLRTYDHVTVAPSTDSAFEADQALLTGVLREVIALSEGPAALALLDEAVELGRRARQGSDDDADALAELVARLDLDRMEVLVRALTRWFQLINLAEDNERVRRLRGRDLADPQTPRKGSLREAIARLQSSGMTRAQLQELLSQAELRLVMTAHPTEARRRTTTASSARQCPVGCSGSQWGWDRHSSTSATAWPPTAPGASG